MEVEKVYGIQDLNAETPGWDAMAKKIRDAYIANRGVRHVDAEAMKLIEKEE